jgi:succinate dehydrogenase / fumarate reductase, iron-sulfur subunit
VVDNKYDPLVWLGRKIFRRDELEKQDKEPARAAASSSGSSGSSGSLTGSTGENMTPSQTPGVTGVASGTSSPPFSSARQPEPPHVGPDGKLDVAEILSTKPGGPSPFGDELEFPLPSDRVIYRHPEPDKDDH